MYIYICYEEDNGVLIVADSVESAIDYLIADNWITEGTEIHIDNSGYGDWVELGNHFGDEWETIIRNLSRNNFNLMFFERFYIRKDELYTKKNKG